MPRYVCDVMIFAQSEFEAESLAEAREHFHRSFGTRDAPPAEMMVSVDETNSAPTRLINIDSSVGMIAMRTGVAYVPPAP